MTGKLAPLPKITPSVVKMMVESEARPYAELANAYATYNPTKLALAVEQHTATFAAVRFVVAECLAHRISGTYDTRSSMYTEAHDCVWQRHHSFFL
jgi:hypothetical protein